MIVSKYLNLVNINYIDNHFKGSPQYIMMGFNVKVKVSTLAIQFQGGFAGKECKLEGGLDSKQLQHIQNFYPKDINSYQVSFFSKLYINFALLVLLYV